MNTPATTNRNMNKSLPRMTQRQRQEAVKLIRSICSGYENGNCVYLDSGDTAPCPQCNSYSVNCKFFRDVLLEDRDGLSLKSQIFRDSASKECVECGKAFSSKSNNAKYCDICKSSIARRQKAAYARKRRQGVEKLSC